MSNDATGIRVNTEFYDGDLRSIAIVNPSKNPNERLVEVRTRLWYHTVINSPARDINEVGVRFSREEVQRMLDLIDGRTVRDNQDDRWKCEPLHVDISAIADRKPIARTPQPPDLRGHPYRGHTVPECDHGVTYDRSQISAGAPAHEVRKKYPRLDGTCPLGCGYVGIAYASMEHYVMGDW